MKKTIAVMLSIMVLVVTLVITGCTRQTNVEFTVEGLDGVHIMSDSSQTFGSYSRQEYENGKLVKFSIAFKTDGDYSFLLVDKNENSYPLTLRVHNGQVEAETTDGVTVNATIR